MMNNSVDILMITLVLANLALLGTSRLNTCIRIVAAQGIALGLLPLALNGWRPGWHLVLFSLLLIGLKGIVFPAILVKTLRDLKTSREIEPFIGCGASIAAGAAALVVCMWLGSRLPRPVDVSSSLLVPVALFTIMAGFLLIISRKKALTQVLGYLFSKTASSPSAWPWWRSSRSWSRSAFCWMSSPRSSSWASPSFTSIESSTTSTRTSCPT